MTHMLDVTDIGTVANFIAATAKILFESGILKLLRNGFGSGLALVSPILLQVELSDKIAISSSLMVLNLNEMYW